MTTLKAWSTPPETFRLIVLSDGDSSVIESFHKIWQIREKDFDLQIARLPGRDQATGPAPFKRYSYAIYFEKEPPPFFLDYWQEQAGAALFYKPLIEPIPTAQPLPVTGLFLPWGYEGDSTLQTGKGLALVGVGQDEQPVACTFDLVFHNLFDYFPGATVADLGSPVETVSGQAAASGLEAWNFPVQVKLTKVVASAHGHADLDAEILRLRDEIDLMQYLLQHLELDRMEMEPPNYLYLYTDSEERGDGTLNNLKQWFIQAPNKAINEFEYTCIEVKGIHIWQHELSGDSRPLVLHVLRRGDPDQPPLFEPPKARYKLLLNNRWNRKALRIYTPEHLQIYPNPPRESERILSLLSDAMWETGQMTVGQKEKIKQNSALVFLQHEGSIVRFLLDDEQFEPLGGQIPTLNFRCIHEFQKTAAVQVGPLLESAREELKKSFENHQAQGRGILMEIERKHIKKQEFHQEKIGHALHKIEELKQARQAIDGLYQRRHDSWSNFRRDVLRMDREKALMAYPNAIKSPLNMIDSVRELAISLCHTGDVNKRKEDIIKELNEIISAIQAYEPASRTGKN